MWCLPPGPDPAFVAAMGDVPDVDERPYDPSHPVVRGAEASKRLVIESRQELPTRPGDLAEQDADVRPQRHGQPVPVHRALRTAGGR